MARSARSETTPNARAKIFTNGRSQAVRLPREFRFEGKEVAIRKVVRKRCLTRRDRSTI
ncbi:MAG: AbrB/MazE/SpoVT family DNA-binding domain-containing protein [Acidobacteriia bacterium]|nr:AbrB/MazE/SpoVT family DNA-binding domain-containing protein [Terriglobia bacterium]